jgi:hypothetical protein
MHQWISTKNPAPHLHTTLRKQLIHISKLYKNLNQKEAAALEWYLLPNTGEIILHSKHPIKTTQETNITGHHFSIDNPPIFQKKTIYSHYIINEWLCYVVTQKSFIDCLKQTIEIMANNIKTSYQNHPDSDDKKTDLEKIDLLLALIDEHNPSPHWYIKQLGHYLQGNPRTTPHMAVLQSDVNSAQLYDAPIHPILIDFHFQLPTRAEPYTTSERWRLLGNYIAENQIDETTYSQIAYQLDLLDPAPVITFFKETNPQNPLYLFLTGKSNHISLPYLPVSFMVTYKEGINHTVPPVAILHTAIAYGADDQWKGQRIVDVLQPLGPFQHLLDQIRKYDLPETTKVLWEECVTNYIKQPHTHLDKDAGLQIITPSPTPPTWAEKSFGFNGSIPTSQKTQDKNDNFQSMLKKGIQQRIKMNSEKNEKTEINTTMPFYSH